MAKTTKPWEEDWQPSREGSRTLVCGSDPYPAADFYGSEGDGRIKLAAAAPDMARMLIDREWTGEGTVPGSGEHELACVHCWGLRPKHEPDCRWVAVMRKAGVRP
ncbi:hypothetical protein AKJ09_03686 [Labilithrix luteola]|uniref:Uncharacterized protein n=1 Tax=Labilithrix luteola TaxID=1391654 RepID=A0A0K1PU28_9BACT|nr:hypothetical protein [Labilithrix luteola]AKU97022.1 hypothetical protein AKJ09_03686 [Labilithrix luteola]